MSTARKAAGYGSLRIMTREVLPNVLPAIVVLFSLEMGIAVIVEAILCFVDLSISSDDPTWGSMIAEGRGIVHQAWWVLVFPLICLFLTVLGFSQFGDGLRRALRSGDATSAPFLEIDGLSARLRRGGPTAACCAGLDRRGGRARRIGLVGESGAGKSMIGRGDLRHPAARRRGHRGRDAARGTRICSTSPTASAARLVGRQRGADPAGPADRAQSRRADREPDDRPAAAHSAACRRAPRAPAPSACSRKCTSRSPARVFRRYPHDFPAACASAC